MSEIICNTSPIQYLHQLGLLHLLEGLAGQITVPTAVVHELEVGRRLGIGLPEIEAFPWVTVRSPNSIPVLRLVTDLGPGETEVLALALEAEAPIAILDDALARQVAELLKLRLTGTLGLLLDAKRKGLIARVGPVLDELQALGFRVAAHTRTAVLKLAGETTLHERSSKPDALFLTASRNNAGRD